MTMFQKSAADPGGVSPPWLLARRCRFWSRLWTLAALAWGYYWGGLFGWSGAFLGGALVEVNLDLLILALKKPGQTTLGPTLGRFYLAFGLTAVFCLAVIKFRWGHPLTFLAGLSSFFLGLVLTLVELAWKNGSPPRNR